MLEDSNQYLDFPLLLSFKDFSASTPNETITASSAFEDSNQSLEIPLTNQSGT